MKKADRIIICSNEVRLYSEACKFYPDIPINYYSKGIALFMLYQETNDNTYLVKILSCFDKAIRLAPTEISFIGARAIFWAKNNDKNLAYEDLNDIKDSNLYNYYFNRVNEILEATHNIKETDIIEDFVHIQNDEKSEGQDNLTKEKFSSQIIETSGEVNHHLNSSDQ